MGGFSLFVPSSHLEGVYLGEHSFCPCALLRVIREPVLLQGCVNHTAALWSEWLGSQPEDREWELASGGSLSVHIWPPVRVAFGACGKGAELSPTAYRFRSHSPIWGGRYVRPSHSHKLLNTAPLWPHPYLNTVRAGPNWGASFGDSRIPCRVVYPHNISHSEHTFFGGAVVIPRAWLSTPLPHSLVLRFGRQSCLVVGFNPPIQGILSVHSGQVPSILRGCQTPRFDS
jgi:hypothetical protein